MTTDYAVGVVEAASASDGGDALFADCLVSEQAFATETLYHTLCAPLTPTTFRLQFPEFADSVAYTERQVGFYIGMAVKLLNPARWGDMLQEGQSLVAAHFLAMARMSATQPGGMAGIPGSAIGVINSGSVDKVSFGKDVSSVMEDGAGHWNSTVYGMQYIHFVRLFGAGPLQVGVGPGWGGWGEFGQSAGLFAAGQLAGLEQSAAGAWPGPFPNPNQSW